jgi:hypothetical protein
MSIIVHTLQEYFQELDKELIGIDKITDDIFEYHAKDVLIQSHWELPIIVQYPNSTITFEFSSTYVSLLLK